MIADVAAFCKSDKALAFDNLMCLSAVDYPKETPPRLELVYHLWSYAHTHGFVLKVHLPRESPAVRTVENVWGVANWHEREAYDMFGITFTGTPTCGASCCPTTGSAFRCARTGWTRTSTTACT